MAQLSKLLLAGGLMISPLSSVSAKQYVLMSAPVEHQIMNISPNGKWACGIYFDYTQASYGFRWNLEVVRWNCSVRPMPRRHGQWPTTVLLQVPSLPTNSMAK